MGLLYFIKKIPTLNECNGSLGEWLAKNYAKIVTDALVIHDVLIDGAEGYTSQIDLLMIGGKGIYVVEVKMFTDAKIYGDGNKSKWYYYSHGKKYDIYSPLKQNKKHIEYLKIFLKDFGEIPCFSVITIICDDFKVSNINQTDTIDTVICSSLPAMRRGMHKIAEDKPVIFDEAKKQAIFKYIQENQHRGKDMREEHKRNVIAYKESIEEMQKQKICPYCKTPLVLRKGKYGEFYGCTNYPKCRYTYKQK